MLPSIQDNFIGIRFFRSWLVELPFTMVAGKPIGYGTDVIECNYSGSMRILEAKV